MSINFTGIAATNYIGAPYSVPIQAATQGARAAPLQFNWTTYCYLSGSFVSAVAVNVNLQSGPAMAAPLLSQIRSVYIDNTGSNVPIYVQCVDTGYTVTAQPYTVGWYPVFTNGAQFIIAGLNFNSTSIPNTLVMFCNIFVRPFTDTALQSTLDNFLSSPTIGGGAALFSIVPIIAGTWYAAGTLNISGVGGGTAVGNINSYGQFQYVTIENGGMYLGPPTVTATGAQTPPPAWISGQAQQSGVTLCSYGGTTWIATRTNAGNTNPPGSPNGFWNNLNVSSTPIAATFLAVLTPVSASIISSGYAPPALGDQAASYVDNVTKNGVFRNNLFGSPFSTGFIYLTHFQAKFLTVADATGGLIQWEFTSSDGTETPYNLAAVYTALGEDCISLQKMNHKLDATKTWQLNMTAVEVSGGSVNLMHAFVWTYSQF